MNMHNFLNPFVLRTSVKFNGAIMPNFRLRDYARLVNSLMLKQR